MTKGNRGKTRWHSHRRKFNITSDKYKKDKRQDDIHIGAYLNLTHRSKLNITSDKYEKRQ